MVQPRRPGLSLALIAKDETVDLPRCLDSVRGLVDEMVVVDTGSVDGTPDLARELGAKVGSFPWCGDFSAARNASLQLCTLEWVLVLDADEAIDPADHPAIRTAIEAPAAAAYALLIRDYFRSGAHYGLNQAVQPNTSTFGPCREFSHQLSYWNLRLFRRQEGPVFRGRVHEMPDPYFQERGLPVVRLDAVIHHFGRADLDRDRAKQAAYTTLAKADAAAHPADPWAHYNLVQQALVTQDWEAVLASADAYCRLQTRVPLLIHIGAAQASSHLGQPEAAFKHLQAILSEQPSHAVALHTRGEVLERLARDEEAQASYLQAIETEPTFSLPFLSLARLLDRSGNPGAALEVLHAGLDQNPKDETLWTELVGLCARRWPERAAAEAWDALRVLPDGGGGLWHELVAATLRGRGAEGEAEEVLRRGLQAFPRHPGLRAQAARLGLLQAGEE